jgi:hypothetical protein
MLEQVANYLDSWIVAHHQAATTIFLMWLVYTMVYRALNVAMKPVTDRMQAKTERLKVHVARLNVKKAVLEDRCERDERQTKELLRNYKGGLDGSLQN